jgi:hypothetical protein
VPLELYGLRDDFAGARTVAGVDRHNDVVNLVSLDHGDRFDESAAWAQVTVCGPLHGYGDHDAASTTWSIDPLPMIAGELLGVAGIDVRTNAEKAAKRSCGSLGSLRRSVRSVAETHGWRCATLSRTTCCTSWRATSLRQTSSWCESTMWTGTRSSSRPTCSPTDGRAAAPARVAQVTKTRSCCLI